MHTFNIHLCLPQNYFLLRERHFSGTTLDFVSCLLQLNSENSFMFLPTSTVFWTWRLSTFSIEFCLHTLWSGGVHTSRLVIENGYILTITHLNRACLGQRESSLRQTFFRANWWIKQYVLMCRAFDHQEVTRKKEKWNKEQD